MGVLNFILAKKPKDIKFDQETIDKKYKQIRKELIITTFCSYVVFYITRKNFTYAMPEMMKDLHLSASDFGLMSTLFYIIYGLSKFISGVLSDRANPRAILGPALIIIGIINLIFASSNSLGLFLILYCLNAVFQGMGFPPIAKTLANWFSKKERGTWYSIWNVSHNVGGALAPVIVSFAITLSNSWQMGFIIPAFISIIMGIFALIYMKDAPVSEGLPNIGEYKKDELELNQIKNSPSNLSIKEIFIKYILKNPFVWLAILGDFGIYIIRTIINDWTSIYYTKELHYSLIGANALSSYFEIGGILGGLSAGIMSDYIFKSNRWSSNLFFVILLIISLILLVLFQNTNPFLTACVFFVIGVSTYGPQMLYAIGLIETTHKNGVCAVTGLKGFITYLGAALSGYPIALIKNHFGWSGVYVVLIGFSIFILITLTILIIFDKKFISPK